jgi:hypothetical protein
VFTKANLQYGTTPFFADRLKEVPRSIKAFSKTPACITYPLAANCGSCSVASERCANWSCPKMHSAIGRVANFEIWGSNEESFIVVGSFV